MESDIRFKNGKLKIMQISDLQDTKLTTVDTLRFVDAALSKVDPDLIVLTGDQLDVVGLWGKGDRAMHNVRRAINGLFSVFEKHGIPYALTFGNHDGETGVDTETQSKIYSELKHCICFNDFNDGRPDPGTFNIPILSSDGNKIAMNLFVMDCRNSKTPLGYKGPNETQLDWYKRKSEELGRIPSVVFQHIPPDEIYELLDEVPRRTAGALPAYGSRSGKYYALNEKVRACEHYGETPSVISCENGEFEIMRAQGDVFGIFFGHDHYNSFIGNVRGIDLAYCPGAGYNTYGPKHRAVRVLEFDESDVRNYQTYIVNYADCCALAETAPIKNFLYCHAPSCTGAAKAFAVKCIAVLAAIVALLVLIGIFISEKFVISLVVGLTVGFAFYGLISTLYNKKERRKFLMGFKNE